MLLLAQVCLQKKGLHDYSRRDHPFMHDRQAALHQNWGEEGRALRGTLPHK